MKARIFLAFAFFLTILFTFPQKIRAQEKAAGSSANFKEIVALQAGDNCSQIIRNYLTHYSSPLTTYADDFCNQAHMYNIDWRLLVAISGVESTFGKEVPCSNAWGWNIYGDHVYCFDNYHDAIQTISKSIREQYMDKWGATDVYSIGEYYAASPTWAARVNYFMNDITNFSLQVDNNPLKPQFD